MKRIIAVTAAALMTSALAGSAYANDMKKDDSVQMNNSGTMDNGTSTGASGSMNSDTGSSAGMTTGSDAGAASDIDTGTTASTGQPTMDDLRSAMEGNQATVSSIKSMSDVSGINVVRTSELSQGADASAMDDAMQQNQSEIDDLQAAINENDVLKSKLEEQDIDVSNVVAAQTDADGSLTVYVNDKS